MFQIDYLNKLQPIRIIYFYGWITDEHKRKIKSYWLYVYTIINKIIFY